MGGHINGEEVARLDVPRKQMEAEILQFLVEHPESTASLAVSRRIIGENPGQRSGNMVAEVRERIGQVNDEVLESCYYIVK